MVLIRAGHDSAIPLDYRSAQRGEDRSGLYQDQAVQDRVIGKRLARLPGSLCPTSAELKRWAESQCQATQSAGSAIPNYPGSITYRRRQQRNEEFKRRFPDLPEMRVLDLGGTAVSWQTLGLQAKSVTLVNLDHVEDPEDPWMEILRTAACAGGFGKYDLVFSNSLLEHLGGHARRQQYVSTGAWDTHPP